MNIFFTTNWNNNVINMNGRLYDPLVGRMFSPDPLIVNTGNSEDFNKYAYALNNPMKYTDPSGYAYQMSGMYSPSSQQQYGWTYYAGVILMMAGTPVSGTMSIGGSIGGYLFPAGEFFSTATKVGINTFASGTGRSWHNGAYFGQGLAKGGKAAAIGVGTSLVTSGIFELLQANEEKNFWTGHYKNGLRGDIDFGEGDGHRPDLVRVKDHLAERATRNGLWDHGEKNAAMGKGSRFELYYDKKTGEVFETLKGNPKGGTYEKLSFKFKDIINTKNTLMPKSVPGAIIFDIPIGDLRIIQIILDAGRTKSFISARVLI